MQSLNYSTPESNNNLQFDADVPLTLKLGRGHQTWCGSLDPEQGNNNHAQFERPPLNIVRQKPTFKFLSNKKTSQLSQVNMCKREKWWCIYYLLDSLSNPTKFQLNWIRTKCSVKTVWHCCDIEIWSRSLEVVWTGKSQWEVPPCKLWLPSHLWCLSKSQCWKKLTCADTWPTKNMLIISLVNIPVTKLYCA